jgi:hypothetical protein
LPILRHRDLDSIQKPMRLCKRSMWQEIQRRLKCFFHDRFLDFNAQ